LQPARRQHNGRYGTNALVDVANDIPAGIAPTFARPIPFLDALWLGEF
jgi:hypothetical protein